MSHGITGQSERYLLLSRDIFSLRLKRGATMKLFVFAALFVAATCKPSPFSDGEQQGPWQVGKVYKYEVKSHNLARLQEGASSGSAMKATFLIRVQAPGKLQTKLQDVQHAQIHQNLEKDKSLPNDLPYKPFKDLEQPFEIQIEDGRVVKLHLPDSVSLASENLLKGLVSALQVDLTPKRSSNKPYNFFDKQSYQGQFTKRETDVTGDCETLYTVSPVAAEWRRVLPAFANQEDPIQITKSRNYGKCDHRVAYHFDVPEGAEWTGTARDPREHQLLTRNTDSRIIAGKQGPIFWAETTSSVHVSPLMTGDQKAEVLSYMNLTLISVEDSQDEWQMPENTRKIKNLLYTMSPRSVSIDQSSAEMQPNHRYLGDNEVDDKSSSSDSTSTYVNDDIPEINKPAYAGLYMSPQTADEGKHSSMSVQKVVQEIAQQLQNANNLPKVDTLTKFNLLVRFISSMTSEQLAQTSRGIEITKGSTNAVKADMWMVFRDAVVEAGTLPAYKLIQSWIQSQKLKGEEAAQVIATLASSLRYPTRELMTQFFNLAMSPEVQQQQHLNSTALIAATAFINKAHVNNDTARTQYPSHMYGRLSHQHDRFVLDEILPRLQKKMVQAIEENDRHKVQVYIRAIGNLGHRAILDVYAPYLEGSIPVTDYQRRQLVESLDVLAHQQDRAARATLYSILRNTAEAYEVRVAAIKGIFMSRPTTAMMQEMALMTHDDPSKQVRAALKSGIESAAQLKHPRYWDLARTAEATKELLTEEDFGVFYSKKWFSDAFDSKHQLGIFNVLSHIGSEDSQWPKYFQFAWKSQAHGWNKENSISASFSGIRDVIDKYMEHTMGGQKQEMPEPDHKYTAQKVAQMLNIQRDPKNPLEATFTVNLMGQKRLMTFNEDDLQSAAEQYQKLIQNLKKGVDFHYNKILNQARVTIMFPVATGVPFVFRYKEPTLIHIQGKAKGSMQLPSQEKKDYSASLEKEIQFTFARNIDGSVGFLDTMSNQFASAGVVNKFQLNIPLKAHIDIQSGKMRMHLEPLKPEVDTTIAHFSVWPYTASQHKDSLVPVSLDAMTKLVNRQQKVASMEAKFGSEIGAPFQLQGYSYSSDYRNVGTMFSGRNFLENMIQFMHQKDVAQTHYNLRYLGKSSKNNKGLTITAAYGKYYNQKQNQETDALKPSAVSDMSPDSEPRRQEMLNRVSSGLNTPHLRVLDLSASVEAPQKIQYVFTAAMGDSEVNQNIQYAVFAGRNVAEHKEQINAVGTVVKPSIASLNFLDALKKDLKTSFNFDIKYGQAETKIHMSGSMERSAKYTEKLAKQPIAKQCEQEMAKGKNYQPACHKAILMAHTPDSLKASVTYKDVTPAFKNATFKLYRLARHFGFWYSDENLLRNAADGKVDVELNMDHVEHTFDMWAASRAGDLRFSKVPLPKALSAALAIYAPIQMTERLGNYFAGQQDLPYCAVEGNWIKTFSNRSFAYTLTPQWHVVVQDDGKLVGKPEQLVILAKKSQKNQQKIYISYRSETGKELEIQIQPAPATANSRAVVTVASNSQKVSEGPVITYWDEQTQAPVMHYYTQTDGVLMLHIRNLRAMYDGQRLVIFSNEHRNNTRGLCGRMSGDRKDDYLTPYGIVDKPEHYGAAFALDGEETDPQTQAMKEQAKSVAYQPRKVHTRALRSDPEWQTAQLQAEESQSWQNIYRAKSYKHDGPCQVDQQVQTYENAGEICISTTPLAACSNKCRGEGYQIKPAQVVCKPWVDQEFQQYRNQIRRGENPQIQGVPKVVQFRVPDVCKA